MKILTAAQMREADRLTTERFGISSMQLMENAGAGVVEYLRHVVPDLAQRRIVVLCGKGNNGGDGFVVARYLHQFGVKVSVMLFAPEDAVRGEASTNLRALRRDGVEVLEVAEDSQFPSAREELFAADIIVDALLGTGLCGPVQGLLARVIDDVNRHKSAVRVIAVDTPSGLPSDASAAAGPVIRADWTVTFTAPKIGQLLSPDSDCCGHLVVHSIGTPRELLDELTASDSAKLNWIEPTEFRAISLRRKADSNKGNYGHALIVAGARGKAGAAGLAGWGALRAGAGLVTVGTPSRCAADCRVVLARIDDGADGADRCRHGESSQFRLQPFRRIVRGEKCAGDGPGTRHASRDATVRAERCEKYRAADHS